MECQGRGYGAGVASADGQKPIRDEGPKRRTPGQVISLALLVIGLVAMLAVIVIVSRALS